MFNSKLKEEIKSLVEIVSRQEAHIAALKSEVEKLKLAKGKATALEFEVPAGFISFSFPPPKLTANDIESRFNLILDYLGVEQMRNEASVKLVKKTTKKRGA